MRIRIQSIFTLFVTNTGSFEKLEIDSMGIQRLVIQGFLVIAVKRIKFRSPLQNSIMESTPLKKQNELAAQSPDVLNALAGIAVNIHDVRAGPLNKVVAETSSFVDNALSVEKNYAQRDEILTKRVK